eukprot:scaffold116347_cov35-Attheya_sp.AAC.1
MHLEFREWWTAGQWDSGTVGPVASSLLIPVEAFWVGVNRAILLLSKMTNIVRKIKNPVLEREGHSRTLCACYRRKSHN